MSLLSKFLNSNSQYATPERSRGHGRVTNFEAPTWHDRVQLVPGVSSVSFMLRSPFVEVPEPEPEPKPSGLEDAQGI